MALTGFPFGGFTMGATGPAGIDVSLDDMIKQGRKAKQQAAAAAKAKKTPVKTLPKAKKAKQPKKRANLSAVTKSAKKRAAVKAVASRSSDKRAAVLAKKRGMSAKAIALADARAKKAAAAKPAVTKANASKVAKMGKAVRVAKKVRVAAVKTTKRVGKGGGAAPNKKNGGDSARKKSTAPGKAAATAFTPPAGTLRISIINDLKTPPKPKPGSQRAGARGKVQSAAAQRKMSTQQRQASGRGGKLAGARGASLASRLGEARVVKSLAGVAKKKAKTPRSVFPAGMSVGGKKQVASGMAAKKRGTAKRR